MSSVSNVRDLCGVGYGRLVFAPGKSPFGVGELSVFGLVETPAVEKVRRCAPHDIRIHFALTVDSVALQLGSIVTIRRLPAIFRGILRVSIGDVLREGGNVLRTYFYRDRVVFAVLCVEDRKIIVDRIVGRPNVEPRAVDFGNQVVKRGSANKLLIRLDPHLKRKKVFHSL